MDLWSLGCMIYQMRVGKTPFHGSFDYEVFKKIQERQFLVPNDMEPETVDIIDRLLQLDPQTRIGANTEDFTLDFNEIKTHPYFKGVNFEGLAATAPPISPHLKTYYDNL